MNENLSSAQASNSAYGYKQVAMAQSERWDGPSAEDASTYSVGEANYTPGGNTMLPLGTQAQV
jgi:hypothetical protein